LEFFFEKLAHFGPVLSSLEMEEKFKKSFFEVFLPVQIPYFWALNWALAAFGTWYSLQKENLKTKIIPGTVALGFSMLKH
jgi:hypothetical protein